MFSNWTSRSYSFSSNKSADPNKKEDVRTPEPMDIDDPDMGQCPKESYLFTKNHPQGAALLRYYIYESRALYLKLTSRYHDCSFQSDCQFYPFPIKSSYGRLNKSLLCSLTWILHLTFWRDLSYPQLILIMPHPVGDFW